MVLSAPTILQPQDRIPSTPSMLLSNLDYNLNAKRTKINEIGVLDPYCLKMSYFSSLFINESANAIVYGKIFHLFSSRTEFGQMTLEWKIKLLAIS